MKAIDLVWRWVPRHEWVALTVAWDGTIKPDHHWNDRHTVRRDAWRLGRLGFAIMRMPRQSNVDDPPIG